MPHRILSKSFPRRGLVAPHGGDLFIPEGTHAGHPLGWDAEEETHMDVTLRSTAYDTRHSPTCGNSRVCPLGHSCVEL